MNTVVSSENIIAKSSILAVASMCGGLWQPTLPAQYTSNNSAIVDNIPKLSNQLRDPKTMIVEKIASFQELLQGWDGYNAMAILPQTISVASRLVLLFSKNPEVYPIGNGHIQLEFENNNGEYIEFEVCSDNRVNVYRESNGVEIEDNVIDINNKKDEQYILKLVDNFEQ